MEEFQRKFEAWLREQGFDTVVSRVDVSSAVQGGWRLSAFFHERKNVEPDPQILPPIIMDQSNGIFDKGCIR